ncbi:unnamed protein product, partial [Closterium sp. NIES-54]
ETSVVAVGAARGTLRTPFFEGCPPSPLAPSYASAAAVDVPSIEDVRAASASGKSRRSKGKGGRGGGSGSGSGGGGSSKGGGGSGGGGSGGSGGGRGGFGGGGGGNGGSGSSGSSGSGGGRTGAQRGGSGGGQRQRQQRRSETRRPNSFVSGSFSVGHLGHRCFSRLDVAWPAEFGDKVDRPHWAELLRSGVAIFDLGYDAILSAMYALSTSAEGDCYQCVPPDLGIEAAALGASESSLPGTTPAEALRTFKLDSGASRCFFRDSTTLTSLPAPVPVRLADPSRGPVVARSSTVLPCPAVSSGSLSGLHLPTFSTNLVSTSALHDSMVTTTTPGGQRVSICTCTRTGRHLATFTRRPGSSLYTLATEPPQVAASAQVSASGQVAPPCSCRLLSHKTLLWHHRLGHPSLPRLRGMQSRLLVSCLPRFLPPISPSPAPPCLPCVEGRQRAASHPSSFPLSTAPPQTLHMDVWGPARVSGQGCELYFLLVVDDNTRYTTVFPLCSKGDVVDVLIPWIGAVRLQLRKRFHQDLPVLHLHSDRGGEFSSDLLRDFCCGKGILQSFTLPASPQQNGIAECRIGLVMEVARTSMIHAAAPNFMWPFAVWYAAHQLNLWPRVSLTETSPTMRWTGEVGDASVFRGPAPSGVSQVDPLPGTVPVEVAGDSGAARGAASEGAEPWGAESEGAGSGCAELAGGEPGGAEPAGVEPWGAESEGAESGGAELWGAEPRGAASSGGPAGASPRLSPRPETLSPQQLPTAGAGGTGGAAAAGPGGARTKGTGFGGTGVVGSAGSGDPTEPGAAGAGGTCAGGARAGGAGAGGTGAGGAGAGGGGGRGTVRLRPYFVPLLQQSVVSLHLFLFCLFALLVAFLVRVPGTHAMALRPSSVPLRVPLLPPSQSSLLSIPDPKSDLVHAASPTVSRLLATIVTAHSFESAAMSALVAELFDLAAACRLDYATALVAESASASPPSVGGECALGTDVLEDRQEDFVCLAAAVPRFASMLLAPEGDPDAPDIPTPRSFAEAITGSPPAFKARYVARGFSQRQGVDNFQTFSPTLNMTTLWGNLHEEIWLCRSPGFTGSFPAGTKWSLRQPIYGLRQAPREWHDTLRKTLTALGFAPSIVDPSLFLRTDTSLPPFYVLVYIEDLKSTGTYVDEVPPPGANIVDGMWIFRVKRPLGSPPAFKARYVARGFSHRQGVDNFQTFSPTLNMTTLWVLLHVAAQRDYEFHFLDFSTAFLQGNLHEEIWLCRSPGFTGSFPAGTKWSLRQPIYGLRQAPREWHDTLRKTLTALGPVLPCCPAAAATALAVAATALAAALRAPRALQPCCPVGPAPPAALRSLLSCCPARPARPARPAALQPCAPCCPAALCALLPCLPRAPCCPAALCALLPCCPVRPARPAALCAPRALLPCCPVRPVRPAALCTRHAQPPPPSPSPPSPAAGAAVGGGYGGGGCVNRPLLLLLLRLPLLQLPLRGVGVWEPREWC